jgi:hypothetical protein
MSATVSALHGNRLAKQQYRTRPTAYTSADPVAWPRLRRSGARYGAVPTILPSTPFWASAMIAEIPKSRTFTPVEVSMMLAGLTS